MQIKVMSINRIQKLLFSEYCDFEDMVLVESPFAQTNREGKGIRQVHIGLTPSKLILATDIIPSATEASVTYIPGTDPYIETFELVAVYPVECVNLSVFHRRKRQSLKAHFCNNNVLYFELGGFEKRNMFWNLWCERVQFLNPEDPGSSYSETSVASSTTNSTMYLVSKKKGRNMKGMKQVWCNFGAGDTAQRHTWTEKYLLHNNKEDAALNYKPIMQHPGTSEFLTRKKHSRCKFSISQATSCTECRSGDMQQLNRFAKGVKENCSTCLFLPAENCIVSKRFSEITTQSTDLFTLYPMLLKNSNKTFEDMVENSVKLWELYRDVKSIDSNFKHRRRYAFLPLSHFLNGLGPWNVTPGERFSIQVKRVVSSVNIRRQPNEPELRLPISKRQLVASVSCELLHLDNRFSTKTNALKVAPITPVIFFWTPEYWYRPRTAKDAYKELQSHLIRLRDYHQVNETKPKKRRKSKIFTKSKKQSRELQYDSDDSRKNKLFSLFTNIDFCGNKKHLKREEETSLQYLRRILRMDVPLTAWDFDSTTLAYQLTLIDRDLFLKIPPIELGVLMWQQSSKNAPNIGAFIAFSHRISCLIATEILKDDNEKIRARLVTRFINTAEKCDKIGNFQTCKSILSGLQSIPVYRLQKTWNYVRKHHASKYLVFETLCRLHRDPRLPIYHEHAKQFIEDGPYIPYVGDIIVHLLDRIPHIDKRMLKTNYTLQALQCNDMKDECKESEKMNIFKKLIFSLKDFNRTNNNNNNNSKNVKKKPSATSCTYSSQSSTTNNNNNNNHRRNHHTYLSKIQNYTYDERMKRLNDSIKLLEKYQKVASIYAISINELAREYLLKARYREEKENFFNSFQTECSHSQMHIEN